MALTPGTRLGPYEILAPIGAGGMGEVYRAKDPRLGREVAIKVLPASFSADPDRLRRFEQEARAAGLLNHPNITAVYDIGTENQAPYVVTELLEGETLRGALAGGRLSARKAVDYALQIAHGLAAAHEKGIVHRDLKPENLFVTKDGRVKILDFGLAKLTHTEEGSGPQTNLPTATAGTEPGVVLGTLGYMSPEQVRGRPADARSDIFSFGAILYEMLSGKRAFHGDSAADTMSAILKEDPPDLSVTNQSISPGLDRIVRHCIEKNPEQRFHSAHDLAFDLEALSGTSAPALSPLRQSSRGRLLPAVAALALVAVLAVAAGFFAGRRGAGRRPAFPTFHRATFRRGFIRAARFAPDGQMIVYSAAWDGNPAELFTTRVGSVESRSLSLPSAWLLAISSAGEMAIQLLRPLGVPDVLARVSLAGGATREVLEGVVDADWAPDAKSLGVIRETPDQSVALEFPIGKTLYKSPTLEYMRISPRGDSIAIADSAPGRETVRKIDLQGKASVLVSSPGLGGGIAWTPDGREIWFSQISRNGPPNVWAVDLRGRTRPVLQSASWLIVHDIAADGKVLLTQNGWRAGVAWTLPGQAREQEVSWLDWSTPADLSGDGKTLLFSENREGGGERGSVFLRRDPSQPAVRLGDGAAFALSPDGNWALTYLNGPPDKQRLVLLPTGAGDEKTIPTGTLEELSGGAWLPDGRRILVNAREGGKGRSLFLIELPAGAPRAISPETVQGRPAVSPDGSIVANRAGPAIRLYPVQGGSPRTLPGSMPGEAPIRWSADGSSLYVYRPGPPPVDVYRIHAATGARELWKQIAPADPAGVETVGPIVMTPDASSWVQGYRRRFSDLYVVEGLK